VVAPKISNCSSFITGNVQLGLSYACFSEEAAALVVCLRLFETMVMEVKPRGLFCDRSGGDQSMRDSNR
jgi:hypothetical protein